MKKFTKGALAASAAGTLLLGGAGSLAFWSAQQTIGGTSVTSGHLTLGAPTCGDWQLDDNTDLAGRHLVPGDTVTRTCTFALSADGAHLGALVKVSTPGAWSGALADALGSVSASYALDNNAATTIPADGTSSVAVDEGDHTLTATFSATFTGSTTDHMDATASLSAITLSVAQGAPHN